MKGANPTAGRWGNGHKRDSVIRTGFTESTITSPKAKGAPPEKAPHLLMLSEPWYERSSRVKAIREDSNY
jgi:hypothetical protein